MNIEILLPAVLHFVHIVATVVWLGGTLIYTRVIIPSLIEEYGSLTAARTVFTAMNRRYGQMVSISIVLLIITGAWQSLLDPNWEGFDLGPWFSVLMIKIGWVVVMIVSGVASTGTGRRLAQTAGTETEETDLWQEAEAIEQRYLGELSLTFWLGLIVLAVTGWLLVL